MTETEWLTSSDPRAMLRRLRGSVRPTTRIQVGYAGFGLTSDRKLRLFACACCRQVWDGAPCDECVDGDVGCPACEGAGYYYDHPYSLNRLKCPHCNEGMLLDKCRKCRGTGRVVGLTDPRSRLSVEVAERYADGEVTKEELARASVAAFDATNSMNTAWVCCNQDPFAPALQRIVYAETEPVIAPATQAALLRCLFGNPWRPVALCGVTEGITRTEPAPDCANCSAILTPTVLAVARTIYDERRPADLPILADALEGAGCEAEVACLACEGRPVSKCRRCGVIYIHRHKRSSCDSPGCDGEEADDVKCPDCRGTGRVPHPLLAHLRQADGPCPACNGKGYQFYLAQPKLHEACPACRGAGRVPAPHALPGCWVLDLILGKGYVTHEEER